MGLASALSTALTGLTAAETQIDVVGNNLANSQTVGFKESTITFTTQFLQTLGLGSQPTSDTGGTNPRQTGLGTQVAEIAPNFTQGTVQTSSSASDVALQGQGFFMVEATSGETLYTRSGIFKTNSENQLVTVTGNRLLGFGVDEEFQLQTTELTSLTIPVGSVRVAQATNNVVLEGILPPTGDVADTARVVDSQIMGDGSIPRPDTSAVAINSAAIPDEEDVVSSTSAGGSLAVGTYRYRFAFADATGTESTVSDELQIAVAGGNRTVNLNSLPSASGEYPALNIYRTAADGSSYYLLSAGATPGGSFVDDGSLALDTNSPLDQSVLNGNYSYVITYARSGLEESRPSPLIGPVNITNSRVHLRDIPPPPTPGPTDTFPAYDKVRIYRNLSTDASTYYFVDQINPGEDYTDTASDATISQNDAVDMDGPKIRPSTLLVDVTVRDELTFENLFTVGTLSFAGRKGDRSLATQEMEITATSTVQDLIDFLHNSLGIQRAADDPADPIPNSVNNIPDDVTALSPGGSIVDGRIRFVSNNGVDNAVSIGLSSFVITEESGDLQTPNLGFSTVQEAAGQGAATDFLVYDSLGIPINVRVTAVMESRSGTATTYRWFADSSENDPSSGIDITVGTGLVTFDGEGNFISATNARVSIDRRNVPSQSPLDFDLDFTGISGLEASSATLAAARQDGSSAGTLSSFTIGEDGVIRGAFSNGVSRVLGQIRLARFANPAGLEQRGLNMFSQGNNSGLPVEGNPGENGIATLVSGAVELSNTDIGGNLIDLVLATTQYRGNTRVITAAQQLLEELLNLRR